jgi:hypothetical protein
VGSGRLLPQLRALELPIDRAANGHALVNSTAVWAGVCALSLLVHDRRCGFRTSSPAIMCVLGREIVSVIHGVGCRRAPPNIAFAQSPPGIGRKRPSLPGQLPGDRASAVPLQLPQMRPVRSKKKASMAEHLTDFDIDALHDFHGAGLTLVTLRDLSPLLEGHRYELRVDGSANTPPRYGYCEIAKPTRLEPRCSVFAIAATPEQYPVGSRVGVYKAEGPALVSPGRVFRGEPELVSQVLKNPNDFSCWCGAPIIYVDDPSLLPVWRHPGLYCARTERHRGLMFNRGRRLE